MAKISTTVAVAMLEQGTEALKPIDQAVARLAELGFEALDINFCMQDKPGYILATPDWQAQVAKIRETAQYFGAELFQSHLPFVSGFAMGLNPSFRSPAYRDYFRECIRRGCLANAMLGIGWTVVHPLSFPELNYERKASLEENHRFYDPFVELSLKNGTGFAFENALPDLSRAQPTRYCQHYEELIELVDSYQDPRVGICWDTGHANQMKLEQGRAIRAMGERIRCLHLNDNHYGTRDEHLLPYMGQVDWDGVIQALAETGYSGTLNYETVAYAKSSAGEFQQALLVACLENARLLADRFAQVQESHGQTHRG